MGCNYISLDHEKCNVRHELKYLLFRDPITRISKEIEICPTHFGKLIEEPLIRPIKKLIIKRDNLFAKTNRERQLAKKNDVPYPMEQKKAEMSSLKEQIRRMLSYRCSNIACGTSISSLNPVYSMLVISGLGKVSYKFYFCSKGCWDDMRGAFIAIERKEVPLVEFFK